MKIKLTSVIVDDQAKALKFYTEKLGFVLKMDLPAGEYRWITLVSPEEPDAVQLSLEPNENPAAKVFQKALLDAGIPYTAFHVDDLEGECARLVDLGVEFTAPPTKTDWGATAIINDTCGNLIMLMQV
jgi:catechol 2,3-dioxygenase-like lactoylglutathione lyase family enzyme